MTVLSACVGNRLIAVKKFVWLIVTIVLVAGIFCLFRLLNYEPRPHTPGNLYTITEFSLCKGWDDKGKVVRLSQPISSSEKEIIACGYLQTNQGVTLSVKWYYQGNLIFKDILEGVQGRFVSRLKPSSELFFEGKYQISLIMVRAILWDTAFEVEQD